MIKPKKADTGDIPEASYTVPKKSASANSTLLSDMESLTTNQPLLGETFLAIDGASQSMVLTVLIIVYCPDGTPRKAATTPSSQPLHYVNTNPQTGAWGLHLTLGDYDGEISYESLI